MRVVEVEALEVQIADVLEMIVQHFRDAGSRVLNAADPDEEVGYGCAMDYAAVSNQIARDIEAAGERFDRAVLRHLEGPCKAH